MVQVLQKSASIFRSLLDVVLPAVCYVCGDGCSGKYGLCDACLAKIRKIPPPHCIKCGRHMSTYNSICGECGLKKSYVDEGWACCEYTDTIKESIHLFKYKSYMGLSDIFRDLMADFAKKKELHKKIDLIVPVPMYATKKREKMYDHAEVLARSLSKELLIPLDSRNLKKIKWGPSQSELNKDKRLRNVKDTFLVVDSGAFSGRNVLIVDDVYTTGATVNECAKTLKDAGSAGVFFLTLARGT